MPHGVGQILDPSTGGRRDWTIMGLDATVPFGEDYGEVTAVPGEDEFVIPGWTDRPTALRQRERAISRRRSAISGLAPALTR